jgi:hypothetical protein
MSPTCQAMIPPGKIDSSRFQACDDRRMLLSFSLFHSRSYPLLTQLGVFTGLSCGSSTGFPLHKGNPYLLNISSVTSPYQCWFMSSKHQVVSQYCSNSVSRSYMFKMITSSLCKLPILFKEIYSSPFSLQSVSLKLFMCCVSQPTHSLHSSALLVLSRSLWRSLCLCLLCILCTFVCHIFFFLIPSGTSWLPVDATYNFLLAF